MPLQDLQIIQTGLTGPDDSFYHAMQTRGLEKFDRDLVRFKMQLNDTLLGQKPRQELRLAGVYDPKSGEFEASSHLTLTRKAQKQEELTNLHKKTTLTETAVDCLNKLADKNNPRSRKVLRDAFYNEVLLQSNMEKYLKRSHALGIFQNSRDDLRHIVDKNGFEQSFNDGLKKLGREMNHERTKH